MLKKVRIKNFKCYSEAQDFDLSLINFVYGNNSVGKSTFLQAIEKACKCFAENKGKIPRDAESSFKGAGVDAKDVWKLRVGGSGQGSGDRVWKLVKESDESGVWRFVDDESGEAVSQEAFTGALSDCIHVEAGEKEEVKTLADFEDDLTSEQIKQVNSMFDELKIGYRCLSAKELEDTTLDYGPLGVNEVGAGIRRIFKCVKSLVKWEKGILLLEEPETNVNEDQLAALTKVIVGRALELKRGGADAQIVVECHSEHMLLKLLVLMVSHDDGLSNSDITVHYVAKDGKGTKVTKCVADECGEFDQWPSPNGFFRARNRIVFGDPA